MRLAAALAAALLLLAALSAPVGAQQPISPTVKPGFPVKFPGQTPNGSSVGNQPLAADLGLSPGFKSIIFGLRNGKLYVVRNNNGAWGAAPGWPVTLPSHVSSSAAVADLNGNGTGDVIVVGFGSVMAQNEGHGGLRAYNPAGILLWEVLTQDGTGAPGGANGLRDPVMATPAIGDVDGDGDLEVVFGALDHLLYVVDAATGAALPGWPRDMRDTVFSSAALHDIDGDGRLDIIVGVDSHQEGPPINSSDGGCLHVLRYDGALVSGFPKCIDQVVSSSPAVGDIDGDGRLEIVHGTGAFWPNGSERVYAWKCDGTAPAGWPVTIQGQVITSPALANLDGDAALEVVVTANNTRSSNNFRLYAFNGNGSQVFAPVVPKDFFGTNPALSAGEPVIADVLGDTGLEILVPTNGEVAVFNAATGAQLTEEGPPYTNQKISFVTQDSLSNVAVTDLETGGAGSQIEVIAVSAESLSFPNPPTTTVVHVWNPVNRTSTPPWGSFHGPSERRTGVAPGTGSCGNGACQVDTGPREFFTVTPCRLVDTRNAAGAYGGPALAAGALRDFTLAGRCGIPAGATALSLNVTVVSPTGAGFVRFSPDCQPPLTSTINFSAGQTRANNAILPLSDQGVLTANAVLTGNSGTVHVLIDVNGYFR